jgi:hypothetical protein
MRSTRRRTLAGIAAAAALALAAGCGGDDSSDATTAVSAEAFRSTVSAICTDFDGRIGAVAAPQGPSDVLRYFEATIPLAEEQLTELKAVAVPSELQAGYAEAMTLLDRQLTLIRDARERIAGGEDGETVVNDVDPDIRRVITEADAKAVDLGVPACASDAAEDGATTGTTTGAAPAPATTTAATASDASAVPPVTYPEPTRTGTAAEFQADMTRYARQLTAYGTSLQAAAQSPEALRARAEQLNGQLDALDGTTAQLAAYELEETRFERIRATVVAKMGIVTATGRELITEAQAGDKAAVEQLVARMQSALTDISTSLRG